MAGKKLLILMICFFAFAETKAQQVVDGLQAPESVVKTGDKIFVSNIGGAQPDPAAKDGNGFVTELSADGKIIKQKFQKTILNGPKGLAVMGNVVYVADIDRIVGFNINSGDQVFELNIPEAAFLNDVCKIDNNMLAISESIHGKVYLVNTADKTFKFFGSVPGANGVTYDARTRQLFACGMGVQMNGGGNLYAKDINSKDTLFNELPNSPKGIFDGLEMKDDDHLLASDWISFNSDKGRFVLYDLKNHTTATYSYDAGSADIYYDKTSGKIYIPQLPKGKLVIQIFDSLKQD